MTEATTTPCIKLRDGLLTATAWTRQSADGKPRFRWRLVRSYHDEQDGWRDTPDFSGTELLRIARLAERAYYEQRRLREEAKPGDAS